VFPRAPGDDGLVGLFFIQKNQLTGFFGPIGIMRVVAGPRAFFGAVSDDLYIHQRDLIENAAAGTIQRHARLSSL
jgi:hypothetical protein